MHLSVANQKCLDIKLSVLEEQKELTYKAVEEYISLVLDMGKQWANTEGEQKSKFWEVMNYIDLATDFLTSKCQELSDSDQLEPFRAYQRNGYISTPVGDSPEKMKVFNADSDSSGTVAGSVGADKIREMSHRQAELENKIEFLSKELRKSNEDIDSELEQMKDQISRVILSTSTKVDKVESDLQALAEKQNSHVLECQDKATAIGKETRYFIEEMSGDIDAIQLRLSDNEEDLKDLIARTDCLEKEFISQAEKVSALPEILRSVEDCKGQCQASAKNLEDLLERKVASLDKDLKLEISEALQRLEVSETHCQLLDQMMAEKIRPLEHLRNILNKKVKEREDNVKQLHEISKNVASLKPRIDELEKKSSDAVAGFSAEKGNAEKSANGFVITKYDRLFCNIGGKFDQSSGMFTAPVSGLYFVNLMIFCTDKTDTLEAGIFYKDGRNLQGNKKSVCHTWVKPNNARLLDFALIHMQQGDTVFSKVVDQGISQGMRKTLKVSCFLISAS